MKKWFLCRTFWIRALVSHAATFNFLPIKTICGHMWFFLEIILLAFSRSFEFQLFRTNFSSSFRGRRDRGRGGGGCRISQSSSCLHIWSSISKFTLSYRSYGNNALSGWFWIWKKFYMSQHTGETAMSKIILQLSSYETHFFWKCFFVNFAQTSFTLTTPTLSANLKLRLSHKHRLRNALGLICLLTQNR